MEETINWLDSGIVCAARQERRKEGMPPGMFGSLKIKLQRLRSSKIKLLEVRKSNFQKFDFRTVIILNIIRLSIVIYLSILSIILQEEVG